MDSFWKRERKGGERGISLAVMATPISSSPRHKGAHLIRKLICGAKTSFYRKLEGEEGG